jgi:sarcosine oxidase
VGRPGGGERQACLPPGGSAGAGRPGRSHARLAKASADEHGIDFEWLDPTRSGGASPQFVVGDDWEGGFGPDAGFLDVDTALHALGDQARSLGVEIREHEPVEGWGSTDQGVWVGTRHGRYTADRLIVTAGAWSGRIMAEIGLPLRILRKTLFWFDVEPSTEYEEGAFPVFIIDHEGWEFYGFPRFGQPGMKAANHAGGEETTPETVVRSVSEAEKAEIGRFATSVIRGATGRVLNATTCLYASTPDTDFVIDRHPAHGNVVFGAAASRGTASSSLARSGSIWSNSPPARPRRCRCSRSTALVVTA